MDGTCFQQILITAIIIIIVVSETSQVNNISPFTLKRIFRQSCGQFEYKCDNGQCISDDLVCDGKEDCADGSEENENCKNLSCQEFSFKCNYGACIDKNLVCNGKKDCKDNSDERSPACRNSTLTCGSNEFACASEQCINDFDICDGKADCLDKSDETSKLCGRLTCPAFSFQCAYGACIGSQKKCDNKEDCVDGSDEVPSLCNKSGTTTKSPDKPKDGKCVLPDYPRNGHYFIPGLEQHVLTPGKLVESSTVLQFKCNGKHILSSKNNEYIVCLSERWTAEAPHCVPICDSALSVNEHTIVECNLYNYNTSCEYPVHGTVANFKCKPLYEDLNLKKRPNRICKQGTWDHPLPVCSPSICGQKTADAQELINNGQKVKKGNYPWQAAVYMKKNKEYNHICGATIISLKAVLSAAHCFTYHNGTVFSPQLYAIAVGKYYISYNDVRDSDTVQFSEVKEIKVPNQYYGEDGNYALDIAVIILQSELFQSKRVQPVCVDWGNNYESKQFVPNNMGLVTGWGYTLPEGKPSDELQELQVPFIPFSLCRENVPKDFNKFITPDKICSGYLSEGKSVCQGDSGGGLVFENDDDKRFYIRGIVSVSPKKDGSCDPNQYALYTKVSYHIRNNYHLFVDI